MKTFGAEVRMIFVVILISCLTSTTSSIVLAVEPAAIQITLDEATAIALDKNRDIQKAREYRNQVLGRYVEERAAALPQLVITGGVSRSYDETTKVLTGLPRQENRVADVELSQALFTWGQVGAAVRAAKYGIATADDQLRLFKQAAVRDVSTSFYDILLARELNGIAVLNLRQKENHLDEARKKHAAGVATDYDVLAADVAVQNARPDVIKTQNLILTAKENLKFLLALGSQDIEVKGSLNAATEPPKTFAEAIQTAVKKRPELADVRNRVGLAQELVKVARAGNKPRLDLKASSGWRDIRLDGAQAEGKAWSAGVYLTFPIFDGFKTQGRVAQAKSNVNSLRIDETKLMDSISLQVREAGNAVAESGEIVKALSGTVAQAEKLLFMAEKGFESGVKTRLDVDDAQLNLTQARANLAKASRDYLVASVTMEWAMGALAE
jgi:outer membrane protein TolC